MVKSVKSQVKKLRNICKKCPKKISCIKPCNEIEKYYLDLNKKLSEEIETKQQHFLPRSPLDYRSLSHKVLPNSSTEDLKKLNKKINAVLNHAFPFKRKTEAEKNKTNAKIKKSFKMYINCATMPDIAKIENCSKQNIYKVLVKVIKKVEEILDKEEPFQVEKLQTPKKFKTAFGLC